MNALLPYLRPVLRRWPIVLLVTLLALAASAYWSFAVAKPSWTATAALTTQSQNRAPEQDAVLSIGYVDYFNQATYQQSLRVEAQIPDGVVLGAKTGAASPIIYIEATGPGEAVVRTAAESAAETFRNDIRESLVDERALEVRDLQAQVDDAVRELQLPGTTDAEGNVILDQIRSLQGRITDISSDATNHLKRLQPVAGAASMSRNHAVDLAAGGIGGLMLGFLAALVLAVTDGRIRRPEDLQRLDLTVLGEFERRQEPTDRNVALDRVVNVLRPPRGSRPVVVAVVGVGPGATATRFAGDMAAVAGARRAGALLVHADLRGEAVGGPRGFTEYLTQGARLTDLARADAAGVHVVPAGNLAGRDPVRALDPDRVAALVDDARRTCGFTVVLAGPLTLAPESQTVCALVDAVVLVAERGITRAASVRQSQGLLESVGATVAGIVLDDPVPAEARNPSEAEQTSPTERTDVPRAQREAAQPRAGVDVDEQTVSMPVTAPGKLNGAASDTGSGAVPSPERQLVWKVAAGTSPVPFTRSLPSDGNGRRTGST